MEYKHDDNFLVKKRKQDEKEEELNKQKLYELIDIVRTETGCSRNIAYITLQNNNLNMGISINKIKARTLL